ncbi:alpha/beta hydrolase family protein [Neobacillus cucumis]|uniref:alpha/beta hydrolase family protein n=1 Tax=Neobacillus cucumis TaxID=1740721 RepID=UPI001963A78A|nr:prolyl oligopeptidase family serine peptidase [Neobacillus cucumis]MBM7653247.1 dipeptidyl aminopeptidase/acylaminoacyl peptidase [Neobacillus cucumis]
MDINNGTILEIIRFPSPNPRVELKVITYLSGGLKVKGMLAEPIQDGNFDGFLYLRGGIKNVGKVRPARIAQFASEGFIVFAPFYRGNQGGQGNEDFAGEDREDAYAAFQVLKSLPRVRDIHIFGFSRGGVMALWAGIQFPEAASVVTWGGVSDMTLTYKERKDLRRMMKRVIGGTPEKYPDRYKERTALYALEKMKAPVLIIHGVKDLNVTIEHAYRLERRLRSLDKPVECWYFEEVTHYFPPSLNRNVVHDLAKWMKNQTKR